MLVKLAVGRVRRAVSRWRCVVRAGLMLPAALVLPVLTSAAEDPGPGVARAAVEATIEGGLLTLDARDAPLAAVLESIAAEAGFALVMRGDLDRTVTLAFEAVAVDQAIRRLAGEASLMMRFAAPPEAERLVAVHVRSASGTGVVRIPGVAALPASRQVTGQAAAPEVRRLARQGGASAIAQLARHLERDRDPVMRRLVVESLGEIGEPRVVPALAKALGDDDPAVRRRAIKGLRQVGDGRAAAAIGTALRGDPDPVIRQMAARVLGQLDTEAAWTALAASDSDPDREVRAAVGLALTRLDRAL